ncbi:MAG: acyl-CoA thioesterase [Muribaculaceae bacterium]|nr:acyl-CoA thioesterase [Muribaculaceae bacterium]
METDNKDSLKEPYIYRMPLKVRDYEVDSQGIVNNANYLHYLEHTRHEFCQERGVSFRDMQRGGIDPVVSKIEISYLTPLRLAETMTSCLWLERKGARFVFHQDIFNAAGKQVVKALVTVVALENGRLSRGEQLAAAFAGCFPSADDL